MAGVSNIEWTEHTWNPIVGCSIVSPGCTHCYAMRDAWRKHHNKATPHYHGLTKKVNGNIVWTGEVRKAPEHILLEPMHRKKPTVYFVNSMGDLFHEDCPDEWIDKVFAVMALSPQHTFQVLTKRAERMREYFLGKARYRDVHPLEDRHDAINKAMDAIAPQHWCKRELQDYSEEGLPLPNVWLGVSAERQQEADERIPLLLQTPAAVRFVSAEPLLGPLDLYNGDPDPRLGGHQATETYIGDWWPAGAPKGAPLNHGLDWVIAGGESGPNARPSHPDWFRSLRDQCAVAEVAFFFKQWGHWSPVKEVDAITGGKRSRAIDVHGNVPPGDAMTDAGCAAILHAVARGDYTFMAALGKKAAGRVLDGVEHNEFPIRARSAGSLPLSIAGNEPGGRAGAVST